MGKSEKLVVLSVLLFVVLLFVWSLQGDSTPDQSSNKVYASESDAVTEPRMSERIQRETAPRTAEVDQGAIPGAGRQDPRPNSRLGDRAGQAGADAAATGELRADEVLAGADEGTGQPRSTKMLLAETQGAVEVMSSGSARRARSSMVDSPRQDEGAVGATTRTGGSRALVTMQTGWDLITTSGLRGTVDPSMFLYEVTAAESTWESVAKDLYGDEDKAGLLRHNNEGMDFPTGPIFVPAKDDLGREASVRTVEVLQGESLWQVAKRTLGKGSEWKAVYEANRDVITDPDFVAPGTILTIPVR